MDPIGADAYHQSFTAAADFVQFKVDTCRTITGRDEAELVAIEDELRRLRARADVAGLAFWQSEQASDLHSALRCLDERVGEARWKDEA